MRRQYVALGTRDKEGVSGRRRIKGATIGAPWTVFAVDFEGSVFRRSYTYSMIVGVNRRGMVIEELETGEEGRITKWVVDRDLLNRRGASALVSPSEARRRYAENG